MAVYRWKTGARASVSAQVAGEVCAELESRGNLTPSALVDASRPEDAPLHGAFEWDDVIAAKRYRETQASYIIRSVEVVMQDGGGPVRAFVSLSTDSKHREYSSIDVVLSNADKRKAMLEQALADLDAFKRKYEQLTELAGVFAELEKISKAAA